MLDAVESALDLPTDALAASRSVLARFGNMSSATLMFVLADMMDGPPIDHGVGLAFGPGLAAEGFAFQMRLMKLHGRAADRPVIGLALGSERGRAARPGARGSRGSG